jgi:hypothetical protein
MALEIRLLKPGEEALVSELIYQRLDAVVSKYYSPEAIQALKGIYTPEVVAKHKEVYVASDENGKIYGTMALSEDYVSMFYVEHSFLGFKAAKKLCLHVMDIIESRGYKEGRAKVLKSGENFLGKMGCEDRGVVTVTRDGASYEVRLMVFTKQGILAAARKRRMDRMARLKIRPPGPDDVRVRKNTVVQISQMPNLVVKR